jgi:glycosyltransferase involved in cell wall biosynthesis
VKIIVDLRPLAGEKISGVKIYLANVLTELFRLDTKNTYFLWWNSASEKFPELEIPRSPRFKKIHTKFSNRILNLQFLAGRRFADELVLAADNRTEKADIFWLPDPRPVAISRNCRLVATIHDLSPTRFPQFFSVKTRIWHHFLNPQKIANSAERILAVSQFTKSELAKFWKIPAGKIAVTPLAAKIAEEKIRPKNLPRKFILALSTLEPRKNLATLVRAFAEFREENSNKIELVIAGDFDREIFADPEIAKTPGVRLLGKIAESEKAGLLAAAEVFCFPSIYEGFGLPPLEAAAAGTPILVADIPPLREILGDAAQFLPPRNVDAWRVGLAKILADGKLRAKMSRAGKLRAREFSWRKTAERTLAAFSNAVK